MEWVYLILILAFISWSIQMMVGYSRAATRIDQQIRHAQASQDEVSQQAERYELQAIEKQEELKELESKASTLAGKEKELQGQIIGLKKQDASRRPTRHKVENQDPPAGKS